MIQQVRGLITGTPVPVVIPNPLPQCNAQSGQSYFRAGISAEEQSNGLKDALKLGHKGGDIPFGNNVLQMLPCL